MKFDGKAFGQEIVELTRSFVDRSLAPIVARLDAAEKRFAEFVAALAPPPAIDIDAIVAAAVEKALADLPKPEPIDIKAMVDKAVEAIPAPVPSVEISPELRECISSCVGATVEAAVKALPAIETKVDWSAYVKAEVAALPAPLPVPSVREVAEHLQESLDGMVRTFVDEAIKALPVPENGKSVTIDDVRPLVDEAVAAIPRIVQDGKDGDPGDPGAPGLPGEKGLDGKDGIGLAGALIDNEGALAVTLTDGTIAKLGPVVGKNGAPGLDGKDGLGFDDLDVTYDGERKVAFRLVQGDRVKEFAFRLPIPINREVFKDGQQYEAQDEVTFGGSTWQARRDTTSKPGTNDDWFLKNKKGRDGKDGRDLAPQPTKTVRA